LALGLKPIAAGEPNMVSSRSRHLAGKVDDVVSLGKQNQLSLERILQLNPDFILGFAQMYNYEQFSQIAPTVAISYNDHDAWKASLQNVGEILNRSQQARQQLENYQDRVEKLRRAMGDRLDKTEVSVVRFYADGTLEFRDSSSFPGSVLKDVGLPRPTGQYEANSGFTNQSVSAERLDLLDGDVMFVALDAGAEEAFTEFQQSPLWQKLEAVQNNQVFTVDSGYWIFGNILAANAILNDLFKYLVEEWESA
jgi:iron complex transport system substrate-binding protein